MKTINKIIFTIVAVSLMTFIYSMNTVEVNATLQEQANGFITKGHSEYLKSNMTNGISNVTSEFSSLGQILSYIGAGVMVAVTAYLGIQYMVSPPDKQGALKEKLIAVVAAGIVIFGAYAIWSTVIKIVSVF